MNKITIIFFLRNHFCNSNVCTVEQDIYLSLICEKGKFLGTIACMGITAGSLVLKLFINGKERCHTTYPELQEGKAGTEGFHDVGVVTAGPCDGGTQLRVTQGTDQGQQATS